MLDQALTLLLSEFDLGKALDVRSSVFLLFGKVLFIVSNLSY